MPEPRRYAIANDENTLDTLNELEDRGLIPKFRDIYFRLQYAPRAATLGVQVLVDVRGSTDPPDTYAIWDNPMLVYRIHEDPPRLALIGLADIL